MSEAIDSQAGAWPAVALRDPDRVMRLARMGSFHQTRLSFLRNLLRRMRDEQWAIAIAENRLDERGLGELVYRIDTPHGVFSFCAFCHDLDPSERTDRVIANRWDFTFALLDGMPEPSDLERLRANVPLQEAGRTSPREIVLSRGNKSVRLFETTIDTLARGEQPDPEMIRQVGYLMRTTAVYGNGKFGLRDYDGLRQGPPFHRPFAAQMFCVYMAKQLSLDVVEHIAFQRAPDTAVTMDRRLKRYFGVGNSTGLGMAPFIVNHPRLLHAWISARETALARVRAVPAGDDERRRLHDWVERAAGHARQWSSADPIQDQAVQRLVQDLAKLPELIEGATHAAKPWDALMRRCEADLGLECQELLVSLLLELYPERVDGMADHMAAPEMPALDPTMRVGRLVQLIETAYHWALRYDFARPRNQHYFWYKSEDKEEPRLGVRALEHGSDKEMRLGIAREVRRLYDALRDRDPQEPIAKLLLEKADLRLPAQRVQALADWPYGEIRDNLLGPDLRPVNLMRCKLSFFGATKFDPKSDRWTRVTLYQGAPLPDELGESDDSDVQLPQMPAL